MTLSRTADDPLFNKVNNLEERLRKVEKHEHPATGGGSGARHGFFHMKGALVLEESDPDASASTRRYTKAAAALDTSGSTMTTVDILVDGTVVGAVSLASGLTVAVADVQVIVPAQSKLTVETTTVGTGAAGLTVALE